MKPVRRSGRHLHIENVNCEAVAVSAAKYIGRQLQKIVCEPDPVRRRASERLKKIHETGRLFYGETRSKTMRAVTVNDCKRKSDSIEASQRNSSTRKKFRVTESRDEKKLIQLSDCGATSTKKYNKEMKDPHQSSDSAHARVKRAMRKFNSYYLNFVQNHNISQNGPIRPDLKAMNKMLAKKEVLFPDKRIGALPGVDVGHEFLSRAEMVALGFHSHPVAGIDYITKSHKTEYQNYMLPLAISIVVSGQYEDNMDDLENLIYTGQGGNDLKGGKHQVQHQAMERGNLALKNSKEHSMPVRVIRGHKSRSSYTGKLYTYDGLYEVVKCLRTTGASGFTIYKFHLRRLKDQEDLRTSQVKFVRRPISASDTSYESTRLVCTDISEGQEAKPIRAVNLVDDAPVVPAGFIYLKSNLVANGVELPPNAPGCKCKGKCTNPKSCECALLNGQKFPYVRLNGGRLVEAKDVVFECGPECGCGPDCINRISQKGLMYELEVFRTYKKGWAVRSPNFIPSGAPVCEYTGVLNKVSNLDNASENDYIFEIDCVKTINGVDGRERRSLDSTNMVNVNSHSVDPEFCIDAGASGNIARFINHSCDPNLYVQCVLSSHHDIRLARVVLYASDNIPRMQELTYDYCYESNSVVGVDGKIKTKRCYCGAANCKKRLY